MSPNSNNILEKSRKEIINITLLIANIATVFNLISNFIQKKELVLIVIGLFAWAITVILTIVKEKWTSNNKIFILITGVITLIVFPIMWIKSHGLMGSMTFYSLLVLIILSYILPKKIRIIIPLIFIGIIITLMIFQLNETLKFIGYFNERKMMINVFAGYFIVSLMIFMLIYVIRRHFESTQELLTKIATTDDLTGVSNRRHLIDTLEVDARNAKITSKLAVLFADVNDFKLINDNYGHYKGDEVLKCLGKTLKENLRPTDYCGRYGGDEFILVFRNTNLDEAKMISERIEQKFNENVKKIVDNDISLAFGFASGEGKSVEEILREADLKMYMDKPKCLFTD
jgi:diguanylate cyclase (GGDEF)-like protein